MEDVCPNKIIQVSYYLNNVLQEKYLVIEIEKDSKYLSYDLITYKFFKSLKNKIIKEEGNNSNYDEYQLSDLQYKYMNFDYIGYLENGCWVLLEEDGFILLDDINNIELMIKVTISTQDKERINKLYNILENKRDDIKSILNDLSKNIIDEKKNNINSNNNIDLIVLNANPLMDGKKELRTMNDFNKIPASIHEAIKDSGNSIRAEFYPLTKEKFKDILTKKEYKPTILHLICKSTYIVNEEGKEGSDFVNLIFEKEDYQLEFIKVKAFMKEMNSKEFIKNNNIKDITLIISTQLSEEVGNIFMQYNFKNIIVQHTTLTDIDFISHFNYKFYSYMILSENPNIKDIFEIAFSSYYGSGFGDIFCCCFHSHKKECKFMKNLKNELYNEDCSENISNKFETIPHFFHLRNTSINENYYNYKKNFCEINGNSLNALFNKNNSNFIFDYKDAFQLINICCCRKKEHNASVVFFTNFNENKGSKLLRFGGKTKAFNEKYIPDFWKMNLLVGTNKVIYEALNFFKAEDKKILNIYYEDNNHTIIDLVELANIIIQYYKERMCECKEEDSQINNNKKIINFELINMYFYEPEKIKKINFLKKENFIFFVIADDNLIEKVNNQLNKLIKSSNKIVILSLKENKLINFDYAPIINRKIPTMTQINKYVKGQLKEINAALRP